MQLYVWLLIAAAVLSWLVAFNVVNARNQFVAMIGDFLYRVTEPVLRPIRNSLPNLGGIDISPIVVHSHHHFPALRDLRCTCIPNVLVESGMPLPLPWHPSLAGVTARVKRLTIAGHGPTLAAALEKISGVS